MAALLCLQDRSLMCREFPPAASFHLRALTKSWRVLTISVLLARTDLL